MLSRVETKPWNKKTIHPILESRAPQDKSHEDRHMATDARLKRLCLVYILNSETMFPSCTHGASHADNPLSGRAAVGQPSSNRGLAGAVPSYRHCAHVQVRQTYRQTEQERGRRNVDIRFTRMNRPRERAWHQATGFGRRTNPSPPSPNAASGPPRV